MNRTGLDGDRLDAGAAQENTPGRIAAAPGLKSEEMSHPTLNNIRTLRRRFTRFLLEGAD